MLRMQIQFTEEQAEKLRQRASDRQQSVAAVVREAVDEHLSPGRDLAARQRMIASTGGARSGHSDIARNHDDYLSDPW